MDQTHAPPSKIRPRGWGLPIGVWLILGFVFIIGAFVTANILAQRSTRLATADVARVQQQFEPLARHARELGDTVGAFDRAVLAYLRSPSSENGAAIVEAGTRLSDLVNHSSGLAPIGDEDAVQRDRRADGCAPGGRIPARRARGAPPVDAPGARRSAQRARRAREQLRREGRVGRQHADGASLAGRSRRGGRAGPQGRGRERSPRRPGRNRPSPRAGEGRLRRVLASFGEELKVSPGVAWLGLLEDDFNRAVIAAAADRRARGRSRDQARRIPRRRRRADDADPRGDRGARVARS